MIIRKLTIENSSGGYAALTATLLTVIVSLTIIGGFTFFAFQEVNTTRNFTRSIESRYISEGGIEDAVYRVITGKQIVSGETLSAGKGTTTVFITVTGNKRTIRSEGKRDQYQQNLEALLDISVAGVNFNYGSQVGEGGLEMNQNSRVIGSVYSNGSIIGASGAEITGDAFVAGGAPATLDQSWEVSNADFIFGRFTGSVIAAVDSTGALGEYNSIILGPDGLSRISYYDDTNGDLKFARCLDENCVNKNIATVDATNNVGWRYTSVQMGQDGFARISYYNATNKDLKFARCTNDDCTAKVLTVVDSSGDVGQFSSLALGADGYGRISYYGVSRGELKFARCLDENCTVRNIRIVDETTNDVGKYTSLALGPDGFARISYQEEINDDLKFARCLDADCSTALTAVVDSTGDVGDLKTGIALGTDGFARISYYDGSNSDLKFARCLDENCTGRNITVVDSAGNVGKYNSMRLGQDGFARISYYKDGDVGFAQCTNNDCTARNISTIDSGNADVGHYTSLIIASDGFGRISYYDNTGADLKYIRCVSADCPPQEIRTDAAQSFRVSSATTTRRVSLYLKKVGNPPNVPTRIVEDSGGNPGNNVMAEGMLAAIRVGANYGWADVELTQNPTLSDSVTYWIVADVPDADNDNYYVWGYDNTDGYTRGTGKYSSSWPTGGWSSVGGDLNFRVYTGGSDTRLTNVIVGGNANAHVVEDVVVAGDVNGFILTDATVNGNVNASAISDCTVNGNAAYNAANGCVILGSQTTPNTPPLDPSRVPLPIATSTIDEWKTEAAAGGTCVQPQCQANGDFDPSECEVSLGPKKITGNLILDARCSGGQLLTVTGTIWVIGNVDISNNARVILTSGYGEMSGVIVADGTIHLSNNGVFQGSGTAGSYLMLLTTATGGGHHGSVIDLHNNATGAIFYAGNGMVWLHQNVNVIELVGKKIHLENNATLTYEIGLQNVKFSSGPAGGYDVKYWKEAE